MSVSSSRWYSLLLLLAAAALFISVFVPPSSLSFRLPHRLRLRRLASLFSWYWPPFSSLSGSLPAPSSSVQLSSSPLPSPPPVTALIKSFERPSSLRALIASLRSYYPDLPIVVVEDSRRATKLGTDPNLTHLLMPFDSGISACRNHALDHIDTPFFILLDDDFVFDHRTRVEDLYYFLKSTDFDLVGGSHERHTQDGHVDPADGYSGLLVRNEDTLSLLNATHPTPFAEPKFTSQCSHVDIVLNFFMARTDAVRALRWDDELKLGEHQDFFLRAQQRGLRIATCPSVVVQHHQDHSNLQYVDYRQREHAFLVRFLHKHHLRRLVLFSGASYRV